MLIRFCFIDLYDNELMSLKALSYYSPFLTCALNKQATPKNFNTKFKKSS